MVEYTPDEVNAIIKVLKKVKSSEKVDKTIRYLDQRHKFFNPTKEMLVYIINYGEKMGLDPALIAKMKEDMSGKK